MVVTAHFKRTVGILYSHTADQRVNCAAALIKNEELMLARI
jgi:hypothetical protein